MLNDREKMVLHFCCFMTIAKMTGISNKDELIERLIKDIRKNRCRSLSEGDVTSLLDEVAEEMEGGRNMFKFLIDETIANVTEDLQLDKWKDLR